MPKRKNVLKGTSGKKNKIKNSAKRIKREPTAGDSDIEENSPSSPNVTDESASSSLQSALSDFEFTDFQEEVEKSNDSDFSPVCSSPQTYENDEAAGGNYDGFASFLKSFNFMSDDEEAADESRNKSLTTVKKHDESEDVSSDESICFKPKAEEEEFWVPGANIEKGKSFRSFSLHLHNYQLVFFEHPNIIPLVGHLKVTLLSGKASIHGYQLKQNQPVVVFSQKETGIFQIVSNPFQRDPLAFGSIRKGIQAQNIVKYKKYKKALIENCGPFTAVVSLQELPLPPNLEFLKLYLPEAVSFDTKRRTFGDVSYTTLENKASYLVFNTEYEEIFERVEKHLSKINKGNTSGWFEGSESSSSDSEAEHIKKEQKNADLSGSRIIVHGPKKAGKSTMIRYLTNKFLSKYSEVFHLETDPGQTEFTPPGALSLTKITKPIFGPPYTHPMTPLKTIFIGSVTPETCPAMHIQSVTKLIEYFNENHPRGILLVNTLGWVLGIGDMLLQVIKSNLNPVVDIQLLDELYPLTTTTDGGLLKCKFGIGQNKDNYSTKKKGFKSSHLREAALLSYLGKCQPYYKQPTYLNAIRPVCVCWDEIAVYNFNKRLPYIRFYEALNCSVVALCSVDEEYMLAGASPGYPNTLYDETDNNCLGFGFVRAVDEERHLLYIVTPLNLLALKRVNAILSGNITVPHSVILNQQIFDTGLYFTDASLDVNAETEKPIFKKLYSNTKTLYPDGL